MLDEPARDSIEVLAQVLSRVATALPDVGRLQPEGLSAKACAEFLGISQTQVYDLDARGLIPEPVTLGDGRCRRWLRSELLAWLSAGAPARARWQLMRNQLKQRTA